MFADRLTFDVDELPLLLLGVYFLIVYLRPGR